MFPLYLRDLDKASTEDLVFFWHIPKAAGSTMKNLMNGCFDLNRAEKVRPDTSMEYGRQGVLNMDTATPEGLQQSAREGIVVSSSFMSLSSPPRHRLTILPWKRTQAWLM